MKNETDLPEEKKQAIRPEELRVGNLIHRQDGSGVLVDGMVIVEAIQRQIANSTTGLFGISLSPEWLERLGFEKQYDDGVYEKDGNRIELIIWGDEEPEWKFRKINGNPLNHWKHSMPAVKHVHQLQNLIFCLTGQELKLGGLLK